MRPTRNLLIALVLTIACYIPIHSQNLEKEIDKLLESQFSNNTPGATVLIVKADEVLYRKAIGMANLKTKEPLGVNQILRIASITKQFTAMAILKLAHEGKLSLQDSVQKFIPGFAKNKKPILIKHLLNHTAGLLNQYDIKNWESSTKDVDINPAYLVGLFKNKSPNFEPGIQYHYSNLGYMVLTHIIELSSKQSYAQYLNDQFFKPLGMNSTQYGDNSSQNPKVIGYSRNGEKFLEAAYLDMNIAQGAGGLTSTVDDLYKWNKAVFDMELIGKYLGLAHQTGKLSNGQDFGYGFGWQIGQVQGRKAIRHDGIINGYVSYQIYIPQEKAYVVILTNCDCTENIGQLAAELAAVTIDEPYSYSENNFEPKSLNAYQGVFATSSGEEKMLNLHDGQLYIYAKGGSKSPLKPIAEHTFYDENTLNSYQFQLNDSGEAVGVEIRGLEIPVTWKKTSDLEALNSLSTSTDILTQYTGKYQFKNAFTLEVKMEGNQLYGLVGNDRKLLLPYEKHSFFSISNDIKLHFTEGAKGEINGVKLIQVQDMLADRVE